MLIYLLLTVQLGGSIAYTYTGNEYVLIPGAVFIIYNMWNFIKINSLVLSPAWDVELDVHESTPIREKTLLQIANLLTLYLIYEAGYGIFSGAAGLVSICFLGSFLTTLLAGSSDEEDEE